MWFEKITTLSLEEFSRDREQYMEREREGDQELVNDEGGTREDLLERYKY